jgi:hypothetical protein
MAHLLEFCCSGFQGKRGQMCINLKSIVRDEKSSSHETAYVRLNDGLFVGGDIRRIARQPVLRNMFQPSLPLIDAFFPSQERNGLRSVSDHDVQVVRHDNTP